MSRSGYSEDYGEDFPNQLEFYRSAVDSALAGKRGQAFLKDLVAALDSMPNKRLVASAFESDGEVCALGAVGKARGIALPQGEDFDEFDINYRALGREFGIAQSMAREVVWTNDEWYWARDESPEERWTRMRAWAVSNLKAEA